MKENKGKALGQMLFNTLFSSVVSVLLIFAAAEMFLDAFKPQGEAIGRAYCFWFIMLTILITNLWNEWVRLWGKRIIGAVGNFVLLLIIFFISTPDSMDGPGLEGLDSLTGLYMKWWNYHFETSIPVKSGGNAAYQLLAAEILLLVFAVILQWLAAFVRKRSVMLVLPLGVLGMELIVGLTPGWKGLAFMFIGGIMALFLDSNREVCVRRALLLTVGAALTVLIPGTFLGQAADSVYVLNEDWLQFQKDVENGLSNINLKRLVQSGDNVSNQAPVHSNTEVIHLTVSDMPQGNIYLRGYHCNNYVRGAWEKDERSFVKSCREQKISEEEGAMQLFRLRYNATAGPQNSIMQYKLTYKEKGSSYCYLPYGTALEGDITDYRFRGDYFVKMGKNQKECQVFGWKNTEYAAVFRGSYGSLTEEDNSFYDWYNAFVLENYLKVPKEQEAVKNLAASIKADSQCREYVYMLNTDLHGRETVNAARWLLADIVADRLRSLAYYSLELDKLPAGEDAVEYFLTTGKRGFCVHFASAGVLMLRELGVPARYTVGYLVNRANLRGAKGAYSASVLDSDAHAWAEIYLDNYGWVPVEMTSGYRGGNSQIFSDIGVETIEPEEEQQEKPEMPEEESSAESSNEEAAEENGGNPSGEETGGKNGAGQSGGASDAEGLPGGEARDGQATGLQTVGGTAYESKNKARTVFWCFGAVILAALTVYAVYSCVNKRRRARERLLAGYIRYGYTRKAVVMINRRLYRILAKRTHKGLKKLSDMDYLAALKEGFPEIGEKEWETYFEVFRRAAYSQESISEEEAGNCYRLLAAIRS